MNTSYLNAKFNSFYQLELSESLEAFFITPNEVFIFEDQNPVGMFKINEKMVYCGIVDMKEDLEFELARKLSADLKNSLKTLYQQHLINWGNNVFREEKNNFLNIN